MKLADKMREISDGKTTLDYAKEKIVASIKAEAEIGRDYYSIKTGILYQDYHLHTPEIDELWEYLVSEGFSMTHNKVSGQPYYWTISWYKK